MTRERLRSLLAYLIAAAVVGALVLKSLEPYVALALAALYLFWGYVALAAIVVLLGAGLILKGIRWPLLIAALALCADLLVPALRDYNANLHPTKGPVLKVISYNWLFDNTRHDEIFRWLADQSADIVAIQEFSEDDKTVAARLYALYPYHTQPAPDLVILSRHPIVAEKATPVEDHAIVRAKLDIGGRQLTVWGVHPTTLRTVGDLAARNYYLTTLAYMVTNVQEPIVMLGDFNATQWDPYFTRVKRRGKLHEEARVLPLPTRMGVRTGLPFLGAPIDHILTNGMNVLSDCHTAPAMGSDHVPLICNLTLRD